MRIFWKKLKNRLSVGGSALVCLRRLGAPLLRLRIVTSAYYYSFVEFISSAKSVYFPHKKNKITTVKFKCSVFASSALLHLFSLQTL